MEKEAAHQKEKTHAKSHTTERRLMHERMKECRSNPQKSLMLYIDGMDQQKTTVPQLHPDDAKRFETLGMRYKEGDRSFRFSFRLIGAITYGGFQKEDQAYGFFFPGHKFGADTNSNLECLRRILKDVRNRPGADGKLPETLYIQMDNTPKDNKNFAFLAYCFYLVFEK